MPYGINSTKTATTTTTSHWHIRKLWRCTSKNAGRLREQQSNHGSKILSSSGSGGNASNRLRKRHGGNIGLWTHNSITEESSYATRTEALTLTIPTGEPGKVWTSRSTNGSGETTILSNCHRLFQWHQTSTMHLVSPLAAQTHPMKSGVILPQNNKQLAA